MGEPQSEWHHLGAGRAGEQMSRKAAEREQPRRQEESKERRLQRPRADGVSDGQQHLGGDAGSTQSRPQLTPASSPPSGSTRDLEFNRCLFA